MGTKTDPLEFTCQCGIKCRVYFEDLGPSYSAAFYAHTCGKDVGRYIPGRFLGTTEEHSGVWIPGS
jgi:hypothetical protein